MTLNRPRRRDKRVGVTEGTPVASPGSGCSHAGPNALKDTYAPQSLSSKDLKIAPIFLRAKRGRSSDGKLERLAEVQGGGLQSQQVSTTTTTSSPSSSSSETLQSCRCRSQLSASFMHSCLQEIQTSNPSFPVRAVFSSLQRRAGVQEGASTEADSSPDVSSQQKRKRTSEGSEVKPKRLRSSEGHGPVSARGLEENGTERRLRISKLSRTHRLRQQSVSPAGLVNDASEPKVNPDSSSKPLNTCNGVHGDLSVEDVLWTDKYSPQHSSEVIGNSTAVNKLQSWLRKWKLRADCDERRKLEEVKREENSGDSWDCGDFQGEAGPGIDREEPLSNTMLITGPAGVGKTASVYACSQELGFKVFEVNCSSLRSGCHVLSQLKEATQSHLVETSGKDPLRPAYFNNYSSACRSEGLPGRTVALKNVTSTSRKRSRRGRAQRAAAALSGLLVMKAAAAAVEGGSHGVRGGGASPDCHQTARPDKKTATSLILFEEVDVIFDEDVGFLAAIKAFMATTKRPVVLTTGDPTFRERFCGRLEEIAFKSPSVVKVCSYLRLLALVEGGRLEPDDVAGLVRLCRGDVRRCLLQLQLWMCSGRGWSSHREASLSQFLSSDETGVLQRPDRDTGCTLSMLGLPPVTQNQLLDLLKVGLWSEKEMTWLLGLLSESWRSGVPLLYSNLELLLPLRPEDVCSEPSPPRPHTQHPCPNVGLKTTASLNKPVRRVSKLSRKRCMAQTTSLSTGTPNHQRTPLRPSTASSSRDNTGRDVLGALTDFFDLMSHLDSTTPPVPCSTDGFMWTGAEMKDGLSGERGEEEEEEEGWRRGQDRLLDVRAAVEGLGCHRCVRRVLKAWTRAQGRRDELGETRWTRLVETLPAPPPRGRSLRFSCQSLCAPSVSRRRFGLSRTVLSSDALSLLGDRRAVCVDYLPVLRHMCRSQREETVSSHLGLSKSTVQLLAEEFPSEKTVEKDSASHN